MPYAMAHLKLNVIPMASEAAGYQALSNNRIEILAGAITPTARDKGVMYSLPFMMDSVMVATRHSMISFSRLINEMGRTLFWDIMLVAVLGQLLFSFMLWIMERRCHDEFKTRNVIKGFGYANWAILSAFLRDLIFEPKTATGRIIMGMWLVCSVVFMTVLASSVTVSIVNISSLYHEPIQKISDLRQMKVGVHSHDSLSETIKRLGIRAVKINSESALLKKLHNNKYEAVIDNAAMLDYFLARHPDLNIGLSGLTLRSNYFSYVVKDKSPLLKKLNKGLIHLQTTDTSKQVCAQYLNKHVNQCAL